MSGLALGSYGASFSAKERAMAGEEAWPDLRLPNWEKTESTLHRWMQIVGKTQMAVTPMMNHWWQVPLHVTSRGLSTSVMYVKGRAWELEFDFISHSLEGTTSDGRRASFPLSPRSVAAFYQDYRSLLQELELEVHIWPHPVELPDSLAFDDDHEHSSYDPKWARALWRALLQADRLLKEFRSEFIGKASPVHFFWGSFDMAVTRFSGRSAPLHPGGAPNCPDWVMQEAYSHELSSAGFWPGGEAFPEAVFYSYAYPEPAGFSETAPRPPAARYDGKLHEFLLSYEAVRNSSDPDRIVSDFLRSTYEAAAELGRWDRKMLEQHAR